MITPAELRAIRRKLNLTQAQLAAALHVTANTIARWEQGVHAVGPLAELALTHLMLLHGQGGRRGPRATSPTRRGRVRA